MPQVRAAVVLLATFQTPHVSWARPRARVVSKSSARCATFVSRHFCPTSTPSPRHTPSTRRPLPAGEDDALGPLLGPLCCSSELRRLGDAAVAHVRPGRSIGGCLPPRRHRACSRRDLYPTNTPSTRHILKLVSRRRRDSAFRSTPSRVLAVVRASAASARLWAGPFCSSRRPSRSASHESGREGWKRDGRVGRLAAHGATRRGGVSAACARAFTAFWLPCVFCVLLRVRAFVLQAAWRGVAVVCLVWVFASIRCKAGHLTRAARVKSGNYGSNPESRVFSMVYSDDTDFFEPALPALASAGGEHGLVA